MKTLILKTFATTFITLFACSTAFAVITLQHDGQNNCELYSVLAVERQSNGERALERELQSGEEIISDRVHYGLKIENLDIDFDNRQANFEIISQVTLGFNRNLIGDDEKASISADNPQFDEVINLINRRLFNFNQVCLDRENQIIYLRD